ncbi:MAG: hypothetical protein EBT12_11520 [Marivivens sp.]|nr:hypothetical protein [Marivivens sp.]
MELYNPVGLEYWLIAEPLLDEATHRGADLYSLDDVYRRIRDGEASLGKTLDGYKDSATVFLKEL